MNNLRPFRFWCQKVLPLVYDDELSYYELLCKVVDYMNKTMENVNSLSENFDELQQMFNTLKQYVDDYFKNLDVQEEINNKLDEMTTNGTLDELFRSSPTELGMNLIAEYWYNAREGGIQGACYIGNNRIVFYVTINNTNTGHLICIDINTYMVLWDSVLELYHANSITYDRAERKLYVCACFAYDDWNTLLPYVLKVDVDNHDEIERIYTAPINLYSICYDNRNNVFYGCNRDSSIIYKINKNLDELLDTIEVESYGFSSQGYQLVENNIIYLINYEPTASIIGIDLSTHKIVYKHNVKSVVNQYRYLKEFEALTYDYDKKRFIGCFGTLGNFNPIYAGVASLVEMGLYKQIIEYNYDTPYTFNFPLNDIYVKPDDNGIKPCHLIAGSRLRSLQDGFTLYKSLGYNFGTIYIDGDVTNVTIDNFNGVLRAHNPSVKQTNITSLVNYGCNVSLLYCNITGENTYDNFTFGILNRFGANTKINNGNINAITNGIIIADNSTVDLESAVTFSGNGKYFKLQGNGKLNVSPYYGHNGFNIDKFDLTIPYKLNCSLNVYSNKCVPGTTYKFDFPIELTEGVYLKIIFGMFKLDPTTINGISTLNFAVPNGNNIRYGNIEVNPTQKTIKVVSLKEFNTETKNLSDVPYTYIDMFI